MPLDLLDTPIRATWSLTGQDRAPKPEEVCAVARRLVEAGIFYLLLQPGSLTHPACGRALAILRAGGCQVEIICAGSEAELEVLGQLDFSPAQLWLDVAVFIRPESRIPALEARIKRLREQGVDPGLLLVPYRNELLEIPNIIELCQSLGVRRFKLPNIGIDVNYQSFDAGRLPGAEDVAALRTLLGADWAPPANLELVVHDLFLWELLVPDAGQGRDEYGGCQAANSLAHIDAVGAVYPCISWPEKLGSLHDTDLADIWDSSRRRRIREEIVRIPDGCNDCRIVSECFGGCRGLSRYFNRTRAGRDLLCGGKR